ncbi:hypothetical protein SAMN02745170_04039, partial [Propionispora hippei DSM 15287]
MAAVFGKNACYECSDIWESPLVRTTRKTGGLITPYKGKVLAESQDSLKKS